MFTSMERIKLGWVIVRVFMMFGRNYFKWVRVNLTVVCSANGSDVQNALMSLAT